MFYSLERFSDGHRDLGTAVVWTDATGRYVFMIGGDRYNQTARRRFFAAVGGQKEPGEDWFTCTEREVREELGCAATILPAGGTWLVEADETVTRIEVPDRPRPAILLEIIRMIGSKAGSTYGIAAYLSQVSGPPFHLQRDEVAGLTALPPDLLAESVRGDRTWAELLSRGAVAAAVCTGITPDTLLYPQGTARAVGLLLSKGIRIR